MQKSQESAASRYFESIFTPFRRSTKILKDVFNLHQFSRIFCDTREKKTRARKIYLKKKMLTGFGDTQSSNKFWISSYISNRACEVLIEVVVRIDVL